MNEIDYWFWIGVLAGILGSSSVWIMYVETKFKKEVSK